MSNIITTTLNVAALMTKADYDPDEDGIIALAQIEAINQVISGTIRLWKGAIANIPAGYVLCDGANLTPDLLDKFVIHADADAAGTRNVNDVGGAQTHTLSIFQLTNHLHSQYSSSGVDGDKAMASASVNKACNMTGCNTGGSGGGGAHNNMPSFMALAYIMKT